MSDTLKHLLLPISFLVLYLILGLTGVALAFDSVILTIVTDVIVAILCFLWYRKHQPVKIQTNTMILVATLVFVIVVWFVTGVTSAWIQDVTTDVAMEARTDATVANPYLYLLLTIVVAPITEELLMRGVLFQEWLHVMPRWLVYIVTSVLFAMFHGTWVHLYLGFVCGMLFAVLYEYTGNLRISIGAHAFYNFLSVFISGSVVIPNWMYHWVPQMILNLICATIFCVLYYAPRNPKTLVSVDDFVMTDTISDGRLLQDVLSGIKNDLPVRLVLDDGVLYVGQQDDITTDVFAICEDYIVPELGLNLIVIDNMLHIEIQLKKKSDEIS